MKYFLSLFVSLLVISFSYGQVTDAFKNKQLINAQTTVIPSGLDFTIQHRFGKIALDESLYQEFFGFDLPANIRFSLSKNFGSRMYLGLGRTKLGKTVDVEGKYLLTQQSSDNNMPVSIAIFHTTGINTETFDPVDETLFFGDSITPFENRFIHRLDHNTQLIVSRKFNDRLSLQFAPTLVYHNLLSGSTESHHTLALPLSGRYQYSFGGAILFEYAVKLNNRIEGVLSDPFSIGIELGTAGHVFQLFLTNTQYIREANIYTEEPADFWNNPHDFNLGFNIRRVWWF